MSERKYYCYCDSNCKFETMTKEQILAAIEQAARWDTGVRMVDSITNQRYALYVSDGKLMMRESDGGEQGSGLDFDAGAAFITKVKETNGGGFITFWVGTQAEFNAIANKDPRCHYHITDSTRDADILRAVEDVLQVEQQNSEAIQLLDAATQHANDNAETAIDAARNAIDAAESAKSVANSKTTGMVREFETGSTLYENPVQTYTTSDNLAKFYIVTLMVGGLSRSIVVDFRAIDAYEGWLSILAGQDTSGKNVFLAAQGNGANVTFKLSSSGDMDKIMHVAGYY